MSRIRRLPIWVPHEASCHVIPRLVDGTHSLDKFRGPGASQTGCSEHAITDIRIDSGHQKCADRTEMPALFLDGCTKGFAFAKFPCCECTRETDLDDADV